MRIGYILAAILAATPVSAATFSGEFWDHDEAITSLADADAVIAAGAPDFTFETAVIDFPGGPAADALDSTSLADFLGIPAAGGATLSQSVFRFTGFIGLDPGPQNFVVGSDDGFRLTVGGALVAEADVVRSFALTEAVADPGVGPTPFDLIYFENSGVTGVAFSIDGALASPVNPAPSLVPLPATLPLLLAGLMAVAFIGRRGLRI